MIRPPRLRPGDTVAIAAPASPPDANMLARGIRFLAHAGFNVIVGKHAIDRHGYLAGSDDARAEEFNAFLRNPDIRAVFCARGGYGSARIVDAIDYDHVQKDPKIILGFSDITTLLMAFLNRSHLVTFHGPLIGSTRPSPESYRQMLRQISGEPLPLPFRLPGKSKLKVIRPGTFSGVMVGGCLSILSTLCGTKDHPETSGRILFIEEVGEAPYRVDRMLTHLKNSGLFKNVNGIILGHFTHCTQRQQDTEPSLTLDDVFQEIFADVDCPVVKGLPVGHAANNYTLAIGCRYHYDGRWIAQMESGTA